jgi:hypothetical protein
VVVAAWVISWLIGVGISVAVIAKCPKVPGLPSSTEKYRSLAIIMGFVPCLGIALIVQLIYLGMYRAKLGRFRQGQSSAQAALSYEAFESGPPQRRGRPGRPVAPNPAYDNSGGRRPARHGRPGPSAEPNPFDEAPRNAFEQVPPRNPFEQVPPRNAFEQDPPRNPFDEAPPRNPFEY